VLPFFASLDVHAITVAHVEKFKLAKLQERETWEAVTPEQRKELYEKARKGELNRPLSNSSINRALKVLAQVLDEAIERELIEKNVARGKKRRLKTTAAADVARNRGGTCGTRGGAGPASGASRDAHSGRPADQRAHLAQVARR
jgi:hypothetical protein